MSSRKLYTNLMNTLSFLSILIVGLFSLFLVCYVIFKGFSNITIKLISTSPSYLEERIGILPDIVNTSYLVLTTLIIVLPLGVGAAIYLNEYATNKKITKLIGFAS